MRVQSPKSKVQSPRSAACLPAGKAPEPRAEGEEAKSEGIHGGALPYVFLNLAMTADGKIATANRAVSSFSSRRDREHLMELRATADAVMSGARTVDLNAVSLGPGSANYRRQRLKRGLAEYNLRVIVSGEGSLDPEAAIFKKRFSPIIVLTTGRAPGSRLRRLRALADVVKVCGARDLDFRRALRWLRAAWGVKRLLCEGGGELDGALFHAGLVDELHLTVSPKIFGGRDAPTIADGEGADSLALATPLELLSARRRGEEMFLVYRVRKQEKPMAGAARTPGSLHGFKH